MDAFISHKRKRLEVNNETSDRGDVTHILDEDEEPTEVKLAILSSLHPERSQDDLIEVLLSCEGSVQVATEVLASSLAISPRKRSLVTVGQQSALKFGQSAGAVKPSKLLTKKGRTLHLFTPEDIAAHTPCSIVHNFLPPQLADGLLRELLPEVISFSSATFKLFDNVVQSPHTACFYVDSVAERDKQQSSYLYNGSNLTDIREILPVMQQVKSLVKETVNAEIQHRIKYFYPDGKKLRHQDDHAWVPNAAFVNCYDGGSQSVGYHSDQLTYLGPRAVIGSLSLGVAREFRVRKIVPPKDITTVEGPPTPNTDPDPGDSSGQIAIHLPHNSLLVMHAEMQEEWKHSIHPASSITPHPIALNKRINITYRYYRPEFAPHLTPRCRCGIPTQLKCVQRRRETRGRYMWMCQRGSSANAGEYEGKGCGFFEWGEFTETGSPIWKGTVREVIEGTKMKREMDELAEKEGGTMK